MILFTLPKIESVTIPSTVTSIGGLAFAAVLGTGPPTVTSVRVEALVPPTIATIAGAATFEGVTSAFSIKVPPGKEAVYKAAAAAGWKDYADKITAYTN